MRRLLLFLSAMAPALAAMIPGAVPTEPLPTDDHPASLVNPVPSKDPWYIPPTGWEATKLGTPLSVRPNAYRLRTFNWTDVIQVMFRTADSHGQPSYAVTTVFVPVSHARCLNGTNTTATECSYGLVSYQHPYDTACNDASPSWAMQNKDPWGEIGKGLERGWFVAVPDYEGHHAAFGANIVAGQVILDSLQALMQSMGKFGFRTADARLAIWGYSSGGTAAAWALELAEKYAPNLTIHGGVVGGMSANQTESTPLLNMKDVAGLLIQGLIGLTSEYPEQRAYLDSRLKPTGHYNKTEFYKATTMSGRDSMAYFVYQDIYQYFQNGVSDVYAPTMHAIMELEGSAGFKGTPRMPVFVHHGLEDEMAPYPAVDAVMDKWCKQGANIHYQRNIPGHHNRQLGYGQRYVLAFLEDIMTGSKKSGFPQTGCKIETVFAHHDEDVPPY